MIAIACVMCSVHVSPGRDSPSCPSALVNVRGFCRQMSLFCLADCLMIKLTQATFSMANFTIVSSEGDARNSALLHPQNLNRNAFCREPWRRSVMLWSTVMLMFGCYEFRLVDVLVLFLCCLSSWHILISLLNRYSYLHRELNGRALLFLNWLLSYM